VIPVFMSIGLPWIGAIHLYSYGMLMAFGFIAANFVVEQECRRKNLSSGFASSLVMWAAISGLIGGRIYDILDNLHAYRAEPTRMIFSGSGFVWYGGLIGGMLGCCLVARRYKVPILQMADVAAPAAAIGQALAASDASFQVMVTGESRPSCPSASPSGMRLSARMSRHRPFSRSTAPGILCRVSILA
jgi:prolipoprotein diacylglyceryltransferase